LVRSVLRPETNLSTDELFDRALADLRIDDDNHLGALVALHERPTRQVVDRCLALCASEDPYEQVVGLRVLRELRHPYVDDDLLWPPIEPIVIDLADSGQTADVIRWAISCLGYKAESPQALDAVLRRTDHPDWTVRFAVAAALPSLTDDSRPDQQVVDALLSLAEDTEANVRSYAIMGLAGDLGLASTIASTLRTHVTDSDEQIRNYCRQALDETQA
jgi:HEAT repeat protein